MFAIRLFLVLVIIVNSVLVFGYGWWSSLVFIAACSWWLYDDLISGGKI